MLFPRVGGNHHDLNAPLDFDAFDRLEDAQKKEAVLSVKHGPTASAEIPLIIQHIQARKAQIEARNAQIEERNAQIEARNAQIEQENARIEQENAADLADIEQIKDRCVELQREIAELEAGKKTLEAHRDEVVDQCVHRIVTQLQNIKTTRPPAREVSSPVVSSPVVSSPVVSSPKKKSTSCCSIL